MAQQFAIVSADDDQTSSGVPDVWWDSLNNNETAGDEVDGDDLPKHPMFLENNSMEVPINGYVTPVVVVITLATNCIVCAVLLRPHMRSPTNALLVAIATSDMLTGVWSVPAFAHFYTGGAYREWVPYRWCFAYAVLTEYVPTVFHTASIWLTVALAVQRYVYVCHALAARQMCTSSTIVRVIVGVFVAAILSQSSRLFEYRYTEVELPSKIDANQTVSGCLVQLTPFIAQYPDAYYNTYFWFRVVFVHLVPCSALVVLTALLVSAMRRAQRRRELLLKQNRRSESRRLAESNVTTLMLVAVVAVFLVVEIPLAVVLVLLIVHNTFDVQVVDRAANEVATIWINTLIMLSYPFNFVIYCGMSRQFRATFRAMFCASAVCRRIGLVTDAGVDGGRGATGVDAEHTNYVSLAPAQMPQAKIVSIETKKVALPSDGLLQPAVDGTADTRL